MSQINNWEVSHKNSDLGTSFETSLELAKRGLNSKMMLVLLWAGATCGCWGKDAPVTAVPTRPQRPTAAWLPQLRHLLACKHPGVWNRWLVRSPPHVTTPTWASKPLAVHTLTRENSFSLMHMPIHADFDKRKKMKIKFNWEIVGNNWKRLDTFKWIHS